MIAQRHRRARRPALRLLLDYGAQPWTLHQDDVSPLREAARVGDADMFHTLLEYGVSATGPSGPFADVSSHELLPVR